MNDVGCRDTFFWRGAHLIGPFSNAIWSWAGNRCIFKGIKSVTDRLRAVSEVLAWIFRFNNTMLCFFSHFWTRAEMRIEVHWDQGKMIVFRPENASEYLPVTKNIVPYVSRLLRMPEPSSNQSMIEIMDSVKKNTRNARNHVRRFWWFSCEIMVWGCFSVAKSFKNT